MNQKPLVSIITVCYNAADVLQETLQSAISQTYAHKELVVVDGGSTDQTKALVQSLGDTVSVFVSEPDRGIYDAMNKAIRLAHGDWVYFLNAGDRFVNDAVLDTIFAHDLTQKDLIYAKVQTINEPTGINYLNGKPVVYADFFSHYPICHQATFTRKLAFERNGYYDTQYRLVADTTWFARFFRDYPNHAIFIDSVVAYYDIQGASYHKRMQGYREYLHFGFRHFPFPIALKNVLMYPLIWLKVKGIRLFQNTSWFKAYRTWKLKKSLV